MQKVCESFNHSDLNYIDKTIEKMFPRLHLADNSERYLTRFPLPFYPSRINFLCYFYMNVRQIPLHKEADSHLTGLLTAKVKGCTQVAVRAEKS